MLKKDPNFKIPELDVQPGQGSYTNPVALHFPDPSVVFDSLSGWYYASRSIRDDQGYGISVCRAHTLTALLNEQKTVFHTGTQFGLYNGCWASELHHIGQRWYIYAAASCSPTQEWAERKMRTFVLESHTEDPFDGFSFAGILGKNEAAIDATVFHDHRTNKLYLCFSRCIDVDRQKLMIQEMSSPTSVIGEPVVIARATYPWELVAPYDGIQRINEGPFFMEHSGRVFCVFSANGCWVDEYCLGIMELVGDDPMNQNAWVKDDEPLLKMGNGVYAPGHASFFTSPDGADLHIAYHAVMEHNPNDRPMPRHLCVQKVFFDDTGFPHVGQPIAFGQPVPLPGGDPGR